MSKLYKLGITLNVTLRLWILYLMAESIIMTSDPRFAGKAIPVRNLLLVLISCLLFPFFYFLKKRWKKYPVWFDNFYLSVFWLDMIGNSLNLYDTYFYFDLLPHFYGAGVFAAVLVGAFSMPLLSEIGLVNIGHVALEIQEFYSDYLFNLRNVRGAFDAINDLLVGILGAFLFTAVYLTLAKHKMKK